MRRGNRGRGKRAARLFFTPTLNPRPLPKVEPKRYRRWWNLGWEGLLAKQDGSVHKQPKNKNTKKKGYLVVLNFMILDKQQLIFLL